MPIVTPLAGVFRYIDDGTVATTLTVAPFESLTTMMDEPPALLVNV